MANNLPTVPPRRKWALTMVDGMAIGIAIGGLAWLNHWTQPAHVPALLASLAASAVLLFAEPGLTISRSWNVIGGQVLSGLSGFICVTLLGGPGRLALVAGAAVALSYVAMMAARALHPPGAATALIVVLNPADQGFRFLLAPILFGSVAIVAYAWLIHLFDGKIMSGRIRGRR